MKDLPFLQQVVDHIEQHLSEKIDVVALANSHAVSPWHFQRGSGPGGSQPAHSLALCGR